MQDRGRFWSRKGLEGWNPVRLCSCAVRLFESSRLFFSPPRPDRILVVLYQYRGSPMHLCSPAHHAPSPPRPLAHSAGCGWGLSRVRGTIPVFSRLPQFNNRQCPSPLSSAHETVQAARVEVPNILTLTRTADDSREFSGTGHRLPPTAREKSGYELHWLRWRLATIEVLSDALLISEMQALWLACSHFIAR